MSRAKNFLPETDAAATTSAAAPVAAPAPHFSAPEAAAEVDEPSGSGAGAATPAADNWKEAAAPDGTLYYYNTELNETCWTKPEGSVPAYSALACDSHENSYCAYPAYPGYGYPGYPLAASYGAPAYLPVCASRPIGVALPAAPSEPVPEKPPEPARPPEPVAPAAPVPMLVPPPPLPKHLLPLSPQPGQASCIRREHA